MKNPTASPTADTESGGALISAQRRNVIFVAVLLGMLLAALDQTIVATALPTIGRELGDVEDMPWVVTAYLLASTAVTPLYGKFSDSHGRRITLLIGIVTFIVGSLACALAPTMFLLIAARLVQGLGGGGLISLAQTIIADVVAPKERGRYQVYIASVFVSASLLGPVLGGVFAEHLHWSVIFWINLPLGALAFWRATRRSSACRVTTAATGSTCSAPRSSWVRRSPFSWRSTGAACATPGSRPRSPASSPHRRRYGPRLPCACTPRASR